MSNGDGSVSEEVIALDEKFDLNGFPSYAYNSLDIDNPVDIQVNDDQDGDTFDSLGGTLNKQGIYSRDIGGTFVHIELSSSIRFDQNQRDLAAQIIAEQVIESTGEEVPEPTTILGSIVALTIGYVFKKKSTKLSNE